MLAEQAPSESQALTVEGLTRLVYRDYPEDLITAVTSAEGCRPPRAFVSRAAWRAAQAMGNTTLELRQLLDTGQAQSTDAAAPRGFAGSRPGSRREREARWWWGAPSGPKL